MGITHHKILGKSYSETKWTNIPIDHNVYEGESSY
jgi:hypothetical protein